MVLDVWLCIFSLLHMCSISFHHYFFFYCFLVLVYELLCCFFIKHIRVWELRICMCSMPIPIFGASTITFLVTQLLSFMKCVFTSHFYIFITMKFLSFDYYNVFVSPSQWSFCLPTITSLLKYSATYLSCTVLPHLNCNATSSL